MIQNKIVSLYGLKNGIICGIFIGCGVACAQSLSDSDHLIYKFQPRDTLAGWVQRHAQRADALKEILKINQIENVYRIPVGQEIRIPRHLVKHTPVIATVTRLNCSSVVRVDGQTASPIKMGSIVGEGTVLRIPAACQFAITLEDDSVLRLMSGATIRFKTLRRNPIEPSPEVKIELLDGRIEIDVPKKREIHDAPFDVLTPSSVAGVRGTEFRVAFDVENKTSQVEVILGAVGARGIGNKKETRIGSGEGIFIKADGSFSSVENLLPAPDFSSHEISTNGDGVLLKFTSIDKAKKFSLTTAEDVNFSDISSNNQINEAWIGDVQLTNKSIFYRWSSISESGLNGYTRDYAFCKGYELQKILRCNVSFNTNGISNSTIVFEKIENEKPPITVYKTRIKESNNKLLVFRGLPTGVYRWSVEHELSSTRKTNLSGQFDLVAIPGG